MSEQAQWVNRTSLPVLREEHSIAVCADPAECVLEISLDNKRALEDESARAWMALGIAASDRVLVSLAQQGVYPLACAAEVLAPLCRSVASTRPRGRLRLLRTIREFRPSVWVTTPCAALDFLARLYMEFNVDPFELGIEHIVLVGEIASPGTHKRLADEFEARVTDLYCDPLFGAALAVRPSGQATQVTSEVFAIAKRGSDSLLGGPDSPGEIVLRFAMISGLASCLVRTGQLVDPDSQQGIFHGTCGQHVLARGRWLSLAMLEQALKLIDGICHWQLQIERGDGTLDRMVLRVGLNRESLVENPMWKARIREALSSVTPVRVDIDCYLLREDDPRPLSRVEDLRGHHTDTAISGAGE